jgi:CRP-like cAMP-binding protein/predicted MFS family arabinose efflux permease
MTKIFRGLVSVAVADQGAPSRDDVAAVTQKPMEAAGEQGPSTSVEGEFVSSAAELDAHDDGAQRIDRRGLTREAFAIPAIRRLVVAFHALTLGEWVLGTAVAISAYKDGGALAVGLVGFRFVPAALAGLGTALLGDRYGRRRVLTATALVRASVGVAVALALAAGMPFGVVLALVWIDAAAGSAYRPAQAGLLPTLVTSPGQLTAASILSSNAKTSGQVLGALAGGLLIATLAAPIVVTVAVGLYGVAAVLAALVFRARQPRSHSRNGGSREHLQRMLAGVRALNGDAATRRIAAWSCARSLIRGLWVSLGVVASLTILGMREPGFGLLMAAAGVGTVVSIPLTAALVGRRLLARPFAIGLALCCLPVAAIAFVSDPLIALVLMVAWGVGMTLADVGAQALLNRIVAPSELARVVGLMESAKLLAEGLGSLLGPVLVALVGIRGALLGGGLAVFALLLACLRGFWAIDRRAVGRVKLLELVRRVPLFASLRVDGLEAVVAPLVSVEVPAGEEVIRQGADGTRWYLVSDGELEIVVDGHVVDRAARGDSFGARGLLYDEPHSATVRATDDVVLLALERADFLSAVTGGEEDETLASPDAPRKATDEPQGQHMLSELDGAALDKLGEGVATLSLASGETLFAEGEEDDRFFVILDGEIEIRTAGERRRVLAPGDGFGELAALRGVARTTTAVARTPARLVAVSGAKLRGWVAANMQGHLPAASGSGGSS